MGLREPIAGIQPFAELSRRATTIVYKGYDAALERYVLLKTLRPEFSSQPDIRELFEREARLLAKVIHPNVVSVYSYGTVERTTYLVTEYVEGQTLSELIRHRRVPPELSAFIIRQISAGLGAAHSAGVLHRDLKPNNILLSESGRVKITDFGLAITDDASNDSPVIAGTLGFLAPEVIGGEPPSMASDLFSCGATFYELLAGQPAFAGDSDSDVIDAVLHRNPMRDIDRIADAPATLLVICGKLLRKDPRDRTASCEELSDSLDRWLANASPDIAEVDLGEYLRDSASFDKRTASQPLSAPADGSDTGDRLPQPGVGRSRTPRRTVVAALVGIAVLALGVWLVWNAGHREGLPEISQSSPDRQGQATASNPIAQGSSIDAVEDLPPDPSSQRESADDEPVDVPAAPSDIAVFDAALNRTIDETDTSLSVQDETVSSSAEPDRLPGRLVVNVVPWAALWIDGEPQGSSFPDTLLLPSGSHEIVLKNPEFPEYASTVFVESDRTTPLDVSLWSMVARLSLTVIPWAEVEIDDVLVDTIPPQSRPIILTPGTHRLRLRHPELGVITRDVLVQAGEHRRLAYNLREASAQ